MKHLQIVVLGVLLVTAQGLSIAYAQESIDSTDIFDSFQIPLESGEIFTIPVFFPGLPGIEEDVKKMSAVSAGKKKTKKITQMTTTPSSSSRERTVIVTAYSSTADQTDSSPCITANGFNVCEHNRENVIAANFLPFGTRVRLPDIYGEKVFTVQDRMNPRHYSRVDIWMKTRNKAKQFGVKRSKVEIVSEQVALQQ